MAKEGRKSWATIGEDLQGDCTTASGNDLRSVRLSTHKV
jgi:hypothetical protein